MTYTVLLALLFGILEGVTEWLPISSTGHLILLRSFLPNVWRESFFSLFEVVIQLAALLAVLWRFWPLLWPFSKKKSAAQQREVLALWGKLLLAALPAAVLGLLLNDLAQAVLSSPVVIAAALIFYGVIFLFVGNTPHAARTATLTDLRARDALMIGLFQGLALVPGTSRSGATILGGLCMGVTRPTAALFSFLLGMPTMLGAAALRTVTFIRSGTALFATEWIALAVGCLCAFAVSLLVVDFLIEFVRRHSFFAFGVYRILLGIAVLATLF